MKCNNTHCMWNSFGQCCPEDEKQYKNAVPNTLDCPSSLRVDFQQQLMFLVGDCEILLNQRNMKELIQIQKFIESQRKGENKMKYYELNDPYYALISAEDAGEAVQLYIANVAGDSEESADIEEELKEVSRDYALVKFSRSPGEDGETVSIKETMEDFNSNKNEILIIDGSLL